MILTPLRKTAFCTPICNCNRFFGFFCFFKAVYANIFFRNEKLIWFKDVGIQYSTIVPPYYWLKNACIVDTCIDIVGTWTGAWRKKSLCQTWIYLFTRNAKGGMIYQEHVVRIRNGHESAHELNFLMVFSRYVVQRTEVHGRSTTMNFPWTFMQFMVAHERVHFPVRLSWINLYWTSKQWWGQKFLSLETPIGTLQSLTAINSC